LKENLEEEGDGKKVYSPEEKKSPPTQRGRKKKREKKKIAEGFPEDGRGFLNFFNTQKRYHSDKGKQSLRSPQLGEEKKKVSALQGILKDRHLEKKSFFY